MIEKDMEDLIAAFPDDFFPRKQFVLIGRQQSFSGVGRFDLLFEDEFKSTILMELKARTLKYEDATQVARYRDELKRNGCRNIVMWLVAPQVPVSVREFLDDKGIEYSEIHVPEFRRVAERHAFVIQSESAANEQIAVAAASVGRGGSIPRPELRSQRSLVPSNCSVPTGSVVTTPSSLRWRAIGSDLVLGNPESFDAKKFIGLVDTFASVVRSGKNKSLVADLKAWAENPHYARLTSATVESLLRWTTTEASTWKASVPYAYEVWAYLFGTPAPTWKKWNHGERRYEFDAEGWRKWFESLNGAKQ
jgi:Endonuclease NucS